MEKQVVIFQIQTRKTNMTSETFFIVTKDKDNLNGIMRHKAFPSAENEAIRLAEKEKCSFLVLQAIAIYRPAETPIEKILLTNESEGGEQIKPG